MKELRQEPYVIRTGFFLEGPPRYELVFCLDGSDDRDRGGWLVPADGSERLLCQAWIRENDGAISGLAPCNMKPFRHKVISLREAADRGLLGVDFHNGCMLLQMCNFANVIDFRPQAKARRAS